MLVYILALGSPTHAIEPEAWKEWLKTYKDSWGKFSGQEFLSFGPMFGHQYSHVWIDFRGIQDEYMREKGIDYFENSRRAAYAQREYAIQNPMRWRGYDSEIWGLTACDGPADTVQIFNNEERGFFTYAARGTAATHLLDDGTIAPTAAVASIAFAPEIVIPTIRAFRARFGENLYQKYGFLDAVNPSFTFANVPLRHGTDRRERRLGRQRLSRHRPGADRGDDRELSQRAHLEHDATPSAHSPRPGARRLHRRLARAAAAAAAELVTRGESSADDARGGRARSGPPRLHAPLAGSQRRALLGRRARR